MEKINEWTFGALPCQSDEQGKVVRPFTINDKIIFRFNINATVASNNTNDDQIKALCEAILARTGVSVNPKQIPQLIQRKKITLEDHNGQKTKEN